MSAGGNRRWITREEIAEVHEAIANSLDENANHHMETAQLLRDTERLDRSLGDRVA